VPFRWWPYPVYTRPNVTGPLTCPACSATNDADQRFCTTCGASLTHACDVVATGRPEEATEVLTHAVVEAERLGHLPSRWPALSALAEAEAALGDEAAALDARAAAVRSVEEFASGLTEAHRAALLSRPDVVALISSGPNTDAPRGTS
jgi:hypothetical protein